VGLELGLHKCVDDFAFSILVPNPYLAVSKTAYIEFANGGIRDKRSMNKITVTEFSGYKRTFDENMATGRFPNTGTCFSTLTASTYVAFAKYFLET
jgi:hypothetical protein